MMIKQHSVIQSEASRPINVVLPGKGRQCR